MRYKTDRLNMRQIIERYILFLIGLFVASLGVAFSTKAGLGTSPVASVPYSVSLFSHIFTFGGWLNVWSMMQIFVQIILLRRKCKIVEIVIQTVLAFAYGYLTNFSCYLISGIHVDTYLMQFACLIFSCFVLGFGIWIQLKGNVAMLPGEAMNRAVSYVAGKKYENVKIFFDILYIALSVLISVLLVGELKGVREGSIIAAVMIGNIIKMYNRIWEKLTAAGD